jgi:hypothetical protein
VQLGSVTSNYSCQIVGASWNNTSSIVGSTGNTRHIFAGRATTNFLHANLEIFSPFLARPTTMSGTDFLDLAVYSTFCLQNSNTSFTGFTLGTTSGTMTGGTIRIYGYNNGA